ncbi:hypothetical protein TrST_g6629 [Triparma strigata]|uniref:Uncharacterized protein n=1 Tax=Triparma strigata TaxID=1606541 RepID=A0A9W7AJB0_9STRA|nr:hypothetical protein TrST_g6629 [Triparma strigata]
MKLSYLTFLIALGTVSSFVPFPSTVPSVRTFTNLYGVSKRAVKKANKELQQLSAPLERPGDNDGNNDVGKVGESVNEGTEQTSKVLVDEDTGLRMISEGRAVMDITTSRPVILSKLGPEYRLAEFSPSTPPDVREVHRVGKGMSVNDIISTFAATLPSDTSPTNKEICSPSALDFVLSNRDLLGPKFKKTLTRLKLKSQSLDNISAAKEYRSIRNAYLILENKISSPFRQIVLEREVKIGPNFSNLDLKSYVGRHGYEINGSWIVLQAMRLTWEKKTRDSQYYSTTSRTKKNEMIWLSTGDPNRFNVDSDRKFYDYDDTVRMCSWAQKMSTTFSSEPDLWKALLPEFRFVDVAMGIESGTEVRSKMYEFCEGEGIEVEDLKEGVMRLAVQLDNMQPDPYGKFARVVMDLRDAMFQGGEDPLERFDEYLYKKDGEGWFETYSFEKEDMSMLRFLENEVDVKEGGLGPMDEVLRQFGFGGIVNAMSTKKEERRKDVGWLDNLGEDDERPLERGRGGYIENEEEEEEKGIEEFGGEDEPLLIPVADDVVGEE